MRRLLALTMPLALVVLVVVSLTRFMRFEAREIILIAAFSPYALIGYVLLLLGFLVAARRNRRRPLLLLGAVASMVGILAHVSWLSPLFFADEDDRTGRPDLTVLTANLDGGQADALTPVSAVRDHDVDLVVLVEVTPSTLDRLLARGLGDLLPYHRGAPSQTDQGTMVFSRFPLGQAKSLSLSKGGLDLRVLAAHPFRLLVVHTSQPVKHASTWVKDLVAVRAAAASSIGGGDTVVAGDFNATRDHRQFRAVLGLGLRDAAEQSGAGWQPTWPTRDWKAWLRPLVTIDHVLTSDAYVARRTYTVEPEDTDHLALIAELDRRHG
ncbi:MAG: endonuclease/exonuclease/phosphatase family protein [Marmoricola sp.]